MSTMNRLAFATAMAVALASVPAQAEDYIQLGIGADYSKGDYGDTLDTEMLALPVTGKVQLGNFHASASVPWVRVEGPDNVVPGDGGVTPGGGTGMVSTREGLGDVILAAGYSLPVSNATFFDLTGKVKLPTADEDKFLGTGTTDFTIQGEVLHSFGALSLGARGGRRFNGSNEIFPLRDVWLAGAGAYYQTGSVTLGLDYDWREGSLPTAPDRSEATASLTYKLSSSLRLQGYGYTGFSDGSPDIGGGLQVLYRFGR